jgi:hypothetical protein
MSYGMLKIEQTYEMEVLRINPAAERFPSRAAEGGTMYCHQFILCDALDNDPEYKCQICDKNDNQAYAKPKDIIVFKVKTFTKNIHTIEIIENKGHGTKTVPGKPIAIDTTKYPNPIMGGTAAALALNAAVSYWSVRGEANESETFNSDNVIKTADVFYNFLISKHNP